MNAGVDPKRTIAELKELRQLTSDENGAQRVAFTQTWLDARKWLRSRLEGLPLEIHTDEAANLWATLKGRSERTLIVGGHLDSVPNGGWLDGSLNVLAGVEVLRRLVAEYAGTPPLTVRLVDWADEEGARFGRSLFGSSACSGTLDLDEARMLRDRDGVSLPDALRLVGVDFESVKKSGRELGNAAAYVELHIEQGPVLLDMGIPLGAVVGTFGVERHSVVFRGQAAHSGSTPMARRRDAFLTAARMALEINRIALEEDGVSTIGSCTTRPGIPTSVVEECRIVLDQRHMDAASLSRMFSAARAAADRVCTEGGVSVAWERLLRIQPILFDRHLVGLCEESIREFCGRSHRLPSGPLHDAAEMARVGIPTAMMFVQSLGGISHSRAEDTLEEHLELCVRAFDRLVDRTLAWVNGGR